MPTPPYAKIRASINGGAPQTGGLTLDGGEEIQLSAESTAAWATARWEIHAPTDYATPAGWSYDAASKVIYFIGTTPPPFTLPAKDGKPRKFMLRLIINNATTDKESPAYNADLVDTATAIKIPSTGGLNGVGHLEETQFDSARGWGGELQHDLETVGASGGAGSSMATANADAPQESTEIASLADGATQTIGSTFALLDNTTHVVDVEVLVSTAGNADTKVYNERRIFRVEGSTVSAKTQQIMSGPTEDPEPSAIDVTVTITNTLATGRVEITNNSGQAVRVRCVRQVHYMTAPAAAAVPAAPTAIAPATGPAAGGTAVTITVPDSTGLTGAKVGGVALTGFAIVDATHVSGTTGAHAAGSVDVVVSNASGDSPALAGAFTYEAAAFDLATMSLTGWWRANSTTGYTVAAGNGTLLAVASAGSSGSRPNFTHATLAPAAGAAVNGHVPPDGNGSTQMLNCSALESTLFAAGGGAIGVVYDVDTTGAPQGSGAGITLERALLCGVGGYFTVALNSTGPRIGINDGGWKNHQLTGGTSGKNLLLMRWDGTNLEGSLNGGAWTGIPAGNMGDLTSTIRMFANVNGDAFHDGRIYDVFTRNSAWTDGDKSNITSYAQARWGTP